MFDRRQIVYMGIGGAMASFHAPAFSQSCGTFSGDPILQLLADPRKAKIVEEFSFIDPKCNKWIVPKGTIVDGASIPTFLWPVAGTPFVGLYRNASIIHDYYCQSKGKSWRDTHLVFYDAMVSAGVSKVEATSKYWAVYHFGPRWSPNKVPTQRAPFPAENAPYEAAFNYAEGAITDQNIAADAVPTLSIPM